MKKLMLALVLGSVISCSPSEDQDASINKSVFLKVDASQLQTCSIDVLCGEGQNCATFSSSETAYCYNSGQEIEVFGCTGGQLVARMSYPIQISCQ
jgi:hypothetical protein